MPEGISIGITASAILYPTPVRIPLGITASAILSTGDYRTGDYRDRTRFICYSLVAKT
ncbi:hypothetical protein [Desulfosporosinus sp. BG]|uniref:hypothetical protein n=1 Tax=Desulfosporosinus sp. BG TaxID=1633135 RepID=UPI000857FA50|nr:hypothetical protein [Desulfosporosinus sp. BG]ODA41696.1 hypothetical protein DSBG_1413 [Desulfosporosinus sp. BG]